MTPTIGVAARDVLPTSDTGRGNCTAHGLARCAACAAVALRRIGDVVVETVIAAGSAPESLVFLALEQQGASHGTARSILEALVASGRIRRVGHLFVPPVRS